MVVSKDPAAFAVVLPMISAFSQSSLVRVGEL